MREREREVGKMKTDGRLLYWPLSSLPNCAIFRASYSSSASRLGCTGSLPSPPLVALSIACGSVSDHNSVWRGCPLYMISEHRTFWLSTYINHLWMPTYVSRLHVRIAVFLFTLLEHPIAEILDWRLCQRSICSSIISWIRWHCKINCAAFNWHTKWSNVQRVNALSTTTLLTEPGTYKSLIWFSRVI